jgi:hypothetical protein
MDRVVPRTSLKKDADALRLLLLRLSGKAGSKEQGAESKANNFSIHGFSRSLRTSDL